MACPWLRFVIKEVRLLTYSAVTTRQPWKTLVSASHLFLGGSRYTHLSCAPTRFPHRFLFLQFSIGHRSCLNLFLSFIFLLKHLKRDINCLEEMDICSCVPSSRPRWFIMHCHFHICLMNHLAPNKQKGRENIFHSFLTAFWGHFVFIIQWQVIKWKDSFSFLSSIFYHSLFNLLS